VTPAAEGARGAAGAVTPIFAALGDPTRRSIVELLVTRGQATATELSAQLQISRQAVSKHLLQLSEVGLTVSQRSGRENRYQLDAKPLSAVTEWVAEVEQQWNQRLLRLQSSLEAD